MYVQTDDDGLTVESTAPLPDPAPASEPDAPAEAPSDTPADDASPAQSQEASDAARTMAARKRSLEGRKQTIQEQINEMVRQREEARRELEALRQQRQAFVAEPPRPAPPAAPAGEPQEQDFSSYADYVKAVSAWQADQRLAQFQQQQQQQQEARQRDEWQQRRNVSFAERLQEARAANPEFDVLVNREDIELTPPMIDVIKDSPLAADLMLHLAHHPDDAQRIYALHPMLAFGEMKALEGRLSAARGSSARPVAVSQAKPPIKPVGSAPTVSVDDPAALEFGPEYVRRMNAAERKRRRL